MPKPTDIELSVNLSAADTKKSADELKKTIEDVFNKSAGGALDSKLKSLQQQMSVTAGKANSIVKQMEKLEQQKLPTAEYTKATSEFEKALKASQDYQAKVTDKILALKQRMEELKTVQLPTDKYRELQEYIDRTEAKLEKLGNTSIKLQKGPQTAKTVAKLEAIEQEAERLQGQIAQTVDRMNEMEEKGQAFKLGVDTDEYAQLQSQLDGIYSKGQQFADSLQTADNNMRNLVNSGKAFTLGADTEEYAKLSNDLADLNNKQRVNIERWNEQTGAEESANATTEKVTNSTRRLAQSVNETAKNANKATPAVKKLSKSTKDCAKSMKDVSKHSDVFGKNLKRMTWTFIKAMIGVRGLYQLFRKLKEAIIDGVKNLVLWEGESGRLNKSISSVQSSFATLKNQIGAAVAPLINALAPALTRIIDLFTVATQKVAMFIAAFTGSKTYLVADKVQKNYAAGLADTAKNAKKAEKALKGYLSPLDEINQYQSQKDDDSSAGGVDTGSFKEVPVDNAVLDWLDRFKKKIEDLIAALKPLKDAFLEGFRKGLGDNWQESVAMIVDGAKRIKDALIDIWTDPEVSEARQRYFESLAEMLGAVAGTVVRIGLNIGANLAQGIADSLEQKSQELKDYLVEMFDIGTSINTQIEDFALAIGEISDVLKGDNAIAATTGFVNIFLESFMLITENATRLGEEIVKLITQPIIDNKDLIKETLDGIFGQIAEFENLLDGVIQDIRAILDELWEEHLHPMFDNFTTGLSNLWTIVLNAWNQYISPVIDNIISKLKDLWDNYLEPIVSDIADILGTIGELISMFWKNVLVPIIGWIVDIFGPTFSALLNGLVDIFSVVFKVIGTILGAFTGTLRAILEFIKTGFTEGWGTAWNNLKDDFGEIWDNIKKKFDDIVNSIKTAFITFISAIKDQLIRFKTWFDGIWSAFRTALSNGLNSIKATFTNIWNSILNSVSTIVNNLVSKVQGGLQNIINHFNTFKSNLSQIGSSIKNGVKSAINGVIGLFEGLVNKIIGGVNSMIGKLNTFSFELPDWVPGIGGNRFGFNINQLSQISIPRLAEGAVIPPNQEFMAMLGDQKQGTNIETPLDTMVQAFKQAMSEMGGNGIQTLNLILPNKKLIAQYAVEGGRVIQTSTGKNPFDLL